MNNKKPIYSRLWFWVVLIVFVGVIGGILDNSEDSDSGDENNLTVNEQQKDKVNDKSENTELTEEEKKAIKEKERLEKIEDQFSLWDGSHKNLKKYIKDNMNDPDSFEHVKTVYWDMNDHLVVLMEFRGSNAFGGIVKNSVKAKINIENGEVIEILGISE